MLTDNLDAERAREGLGCPGDSLGGSDASGPNLCKPALALQVSASVQFRCFSAISYPPSVPGT